MSLRTPFVFLLGIAVGLAVRGTSLEAPRGPWHLGRGWAINLLAIVWVIFITVILSLPDDMRAGKSMAVVTLLLGVWCVVRERRRFHGPAWALTDDGMRDALAATGRPASGE